MAATRQDIVQCRRAYNRRETEAPAMTPTQQMSPVARFVAVRVFPAVLIVVAASAIALGVVQVRSGVASQQWPTVEGEVVQAEIEEERSSGSGPGARERSATQRPVVRYRYDVGGTTYEARQMSFGEYASGSREDAQRVVEKYAVGSRVLVHYRPDAPDQAVLEPGTQGAPWFFAILGIAFMAVGVLLAWIGPKLIAASPGRRSGRRAGRRGRRRGRRRGLAPSQ
jgi:hypothetical protein